jgi:hypothetical protein
LSVLFEKDDEGHNIKNSLHSNWLMYFSEYIHKGEATPKIPEIPTSYLQGRERYGSTILSETEFSFLK